MDSRGLVWLLVALTVAAVVARPGRRPEWLYALAGAALLVLAGFVPWRRAAAAVAEGGNVYLFLSGMLLLSEVARRAGLFDWIAALATRAARGSGRRLFTLVYAAGIAVTALLSNDATAVVLTPAVIAVARRARAPALPLLYACLFVANAASFLLPIANPANLVLFGTRLPPLDAWLARFGLPALAAIGLTWASLRWSQRRALATPIAHTLPAPELSVTGRLILGVLGLTATVLVLASLRGWPLGAPTAAMGMLALAAAALHPPRQPLATLKAVDWGVLPLVAGLFVLVEALRQTGLVATLAGGLATQVEASTAHAAVLAATATTLASTVANNLPVGLLAGAVLAHGAPEPVRDAVLIAVDLGPNLALSGSLASLLWLAILRRAGLRVGFFQFMRLGLWVTLPALTVAIALRLVLA